jgi:RNA polymerase sigma factor (sigma-70 family)
MGGSDFSYDIIAANPENWLRIFSILSARFVNAVTRPQEMVTQGARSPNASRVADWLESPYLRRVAVRVAQQYGLPQADIPDLLQELRIALWKAGPDRGVNATWVFHTASHKAMDLLSERRARRLDSGVGFAESHRPTRWDPELRHLLRARVAGLPVRLQLFFTLRYRKGLTESEVAESLGIGRGAVRSMNVKCLQMIKGRRGLRNGPTGTSGATGPGQRTSPQA